MSNAVAQSLNPYEAPKSSDLLATGVAQIVYDGKTLMIPKDYTFPPICLKTGATTDLAQQKTRKFSWFPPLVVLLIFFGLIVFLIVAVCVSKKGEIRFQVTNEVARKRRKALLRNWCLALLTVALGGLAIAAQSGPLGIAAAICFLLTLGFSIAAGQFLSVKRIDKTHIWLLGIPGDVARTLVAQQGQIGTAYPR